MEAWIVHIVTGGGYWGIAALMVLENVFPPIPSELIMGLGGVAVARGEMAFWPLLLSGTLGSTLGNYVWFMVGDRLGYRRLRPLVERWGRWLTLGWSDVERASAFLNGHGQWSVLVMRFSPFFRTMISLPAGLAHMGRWRFLALTFVGAGLWNALLIFGGSWAAPWLAQIKGVAGPVLGAMIVAMVMWYVWRVIRWRG
jgi:membrane protein DedA with SNARE-associated domain